MPGRRHRCEASRTLVTGASGFVGACLVPHLVKTGRQVLAVHRPDLPPANFGVEWTALDLRQPDATREAIRRIQPDEIVHLAAVAFPRDAEHDPIEALRVNYAAVDHLLGAMAAYAPGARLLLVSSGEVYGLRGPEDPPCREADLLAPPTRYSATKVAAEQRVLLAVEEHALDVVRVRPFNHTGPGRPPSYAESSFARQIVRIERGKQEPVLRVGNLEMLRDFTDVRDVVRAYALLLDHGEQGEVYNVCSGQLWSIRSVVDILLTHARVRPRIEVDPSRLRAQKADRLALCGDPSRMRALGWTSDYRFERTLEELLDDWRSRE